MNVSATEWHSNVGRVSQFMWYMQMQPKCRLGHWIMWVQGTMYKLGYIRALPGK